jgi:hypothetical protein
LAEAGRWLAFLGANLPIARKPFALSFLAESFIDTGSKEGPVV